MQLKVTATNKDTNDKLTIISSFYNSKEEMLKDLIKNGYQATLNDITEL